jgi:hypothetical protein
LLIPFLTYYVKGRFLNDDAGDDQLDPFSFLRQNSYLPQKSDEIGTYEAKLPGGEGKPVWAPNLALMLPRAKEIGAETLRQIITDPSRSVKTLTRIEECLTMAPLVRVTASGAWLSL